MAATMSRAISVEELVRYLTSKRDEGGSVTVGITNIRSIRLGSAGFHGINGRLMLGEPRPKDMDVYQMQSDQDASALVSGFEITCQYTLPGGADV
jgi:hypothetical protein